MRELLLYRQAAACAPLFAGCLCARSAAALQEERCLASGRELLVLQTARLQLLGLTMARQISNCSGSQLVEYNLYARGWFFVGFFFSFKLNTLALQV